MLAVTAGVKVKAARRQWNSFTYLSGVFCLFCLFFSMHVLEGPVRAVSELSSCKGIKVL